MPGANRMLRMLLGASATLKTAGAAAGSEYYNIVIKPTGDRAFGVQHIVPTVFAPLVATAGQMSGQQQDILFLDEKKWGYILLQVGNVDNYDVGPSQITTSYVLHVLINGVELPVNMGEVGSLRLLNAPLTNMYSSTITHKKIQ